MRLNNIVIATGDYEATLGFYKKVTDWPVHFQNEKCCFLGRSKPYIVIHRPTEDTELKPPERTLCLDFEVADLDDEVARLMRAGLTAEVKGDVATLHDPAGNLIELVPAE